MYGFFKWFKIKIKPATVCALRAQAQVQTRPIILITGNVVCCPQNSSKNHIVCFISKRLMNILAFPDF